MEDIVDTKGIEKSEPIEITDAPPAEIKEKPKRKPRSEAQKAAFEKARLKRAENLKRKKEEDKEVSFEDDEPVSPEVRPKAPPKKRGRPKGSRKLKRETEPQVGQPNFLPQVAQHPAGDIRYQYQQPNPYQQFNPMMMYQNQPPPQVHNYYYGHQQGAVNQQPRLGEADRQGLPPSEAYQRPPTPESVEESEEDEVQDFIQYPEETYEEPQLRYRFA